LTGTVCSGGGPESSGTPTQAGGLLRNSRTVLERRMRLPEKWVLAVVSNENLIEYSTGFKGVARAASPKERCSFSSMGFVYRNGKETATDHLPLETSASDLAISPDAEPRIRTGTSAWDNFQVHFKQTG
jgi:hypothetical protein